MFPTITSGPRSILASCASVSVVVGSRMPHNADKQPQQTRLPPYIADNIAVRSARPRRRLDKD